MGLQCPVVRCDYKNAQLWCHNNFGPLKKLGCGANFFTENWSIIGKLVRPKT